MSYAHTVVFRKQHLLTGTNAEKTETAYMTLGPAALNEPLPKKRTKDMKRKKRRLKLICYIVKKVV